MIGRGAYREQLNRIEEVLKKCSLFDYRNYSPNSSPRAADFRGLSYRDAWQMSVRVDAYDFILADQSLLYFSKSEFDRQSCTLSYSYLDCPVEVMTYQKYCESELGDLLSGDQAAQSAGDYDDCFRDEYEEYVTTCEMKGPPTPVRYDYSPADYVAGRHPASHMHFGHASHVRIATKRVMHPLAFVYCIVRQCYPSQWQGLLEDNEYAWLRQSVRDALPPVASDLWSEEDDCEMHLA